MTKEGRGNMTQSLCGKWTLRTAKGIIGNADVPGSLYSTLMEKGYMKDPYYGENEYISTDICRNGCEYELDFDAEENILSAEKILLKFGGIDTIATIMLNGHFVGGTSNMHREYIFDVTELISRTGNILTVKLASPIKYIEEKNAAVPLWGVESTMVGYPHIRKAHYMFGWDWGPKLPDMGIWRNVELMGVSGGRIDSVYVRQHHRNAAKGDVLLDIDVSLSNVSAASLLLSAVITAPDGTVFTAQKHTNSKCTLAVSIDNAQLWYPRGYGSQPLYKLQISLIDSDTNVIYSEKSLDIGLRTITVSRKPDSEGEEFAFEVNGIKIFAMGANYIPEDQIISRCSRERTEKLLEDCCKANYNMIRVWGGGYYPDDWFYDACDRMGLLVWQDFMFACSVYKADVDFCENVKHELICNIKRLRNHPSLALWCGNNEIESMWQYWGIDADPEYKKDYLRLFENLIPKVLDFYDPVTFYHPSSPSSGGGFIDSGANNKGDSHYWDVWHGLKPFTEYFKYKFRFCSEFGFESVPSVKTVRQFCEDKDMNLMGSVMEAHQKCTAGSEKIMYYLAQMAHYPYDFKGLIYASQLVQADAIRLNVENMRRNRGICMGSLYWQVNDSNPVVSWSSIDYFGRWKALHYAARRFYAPVLLSADTSDMDNIRLNVSSERTDEFEAAIKWRSRLNTGEVILQGVQEVRIKPLSAENMLTLTPASTGIAPNMRDKAYIEFSLIEKGARLSGGTCMLVQPKAFRFIDPKISYNVSDMGTRYKIEVYSDAYAKGVCLDLKNQDCVFSDNWFDLHGGSVNIYVSKKTVPFISDCEELENELTAVSYYEAMKLG